MSPYYFKSPTIKACSMVDVYKLLKNVVSVTEGINVMHNMRKTEEGKRMYATKDSSEMLS
jgi:hypothetical protein